MALSSPKEEKAAALHRKRMYLNESVKTNIYAHGGLSYGDNIKDFLSDKNIFKIIIKKQDFKKFYNTYEHDVTIKLSCGKYKLITDVYYNVDNKYNEQYKTITLSFYYKNISIFVNFIIDIFDTNSILIIPYGVCTYREQHIKYNGVHHSDILPLVDNILTFMPWVYSNTQQLQSIFKNVKTPQTYDNIQNKMLFDFIVKNYEGENFKYNTYYGDFYLTNYIHSGLECILCKQVIDSHVSCCISKCCSSIYHIRCLFECYINDVVDDKTINECGYIDTHFKCAKCNVISHDTTGNNSSILMSLLNII